MELKRFEIFERIDTAKGAGINQAHKQIADISAVLCFVEKGVLPMENGFFKSPFTNIVVEGRLAVS